MTEKNLAAMEKRLMDRLDVIKDRVRKVVEESVAVSNELADLSADIAKLFIRLEAAVARKQSIS